MQAIKKTSTRLISETYKEKFHTIGLLSIQIDQYETVFCISAMRLIQLDLTENGPLALTSLSLSRQEHTYTHTHTYTDI